MQDGPLAWADSWAREQPSDVALTASELTLTAGELWDTALRISVALTDAGVAQGELLALAGPAPFRPILTLAALAHGALGIGYGPGAAMSAAHVVAFEPISGVSSERMITLDLTALGGIRDPAAHDHPGFDVEAGAPAIAVSSSGTTGTPKALLFSRAHLIDRVESAKYGWMPDLPFAALLGPGTMIGQGAFFSSLQRRVRHIVPGDGRTNLAQLRDFDIRTIIGSPSQLSDLLRAARLAGERLPALKLLQSGGSPLTTSLAAELADWFGAEVHSVYGATESGTVAIVESPTLAGASARIVPGARVEIVDPSGRVLPDTVIGRVRVQTDSLAAGYLDPGAERSDRGFHDGWFFPGDLGMVTHGELTVIGRDDDLLNAAGVKVSAARVEAFARALPGIEDAVACSVLDEHAVRQIALAFVGEPGADPTAYVTALRRDLGDATPRIIVRLAEIPLTESGKIARATVAELVQARFTPRIEI